MLSVLFFGLVLFFLASVIRPQWAGLTSRREALKAAAGAFLLWPVATIVLSLPVVLVLGLPDKPVVPRSVKIEPAVEAVQQQLSAAAPAAGGYLDRLTDAEPYADVLLVSGTASDWRLAPQIVKGRLAFLVFARPFPRRSSISPNELMACLDAEAGMQDGAFPFRVMLVRCTG